ncbi:hypothetical protein [Phreatobacter stygius]|uniref:Uncharacterized protein n=1 Tax=Phreatobacter stygius TaxID=1940610 RepID=A0A4D7AUI8_9HYPH|nr:hypothetical protein [Phreatobacter stygius]QCI63321.1 hypothetical protein E8M01_03165 [Phreatobacter stygius]
MIIGIAHRISLSAGPCLAGGEADEIAEIGAKVHPPEDREGAVFRLRHGPPFRNQFRISVERLMAMPAAWLVCAACVLAWPKGGAIFALRKYIS